MTVCKVPAGEPVPKGGRETVYIYDAVTDDDMMLRYGQLRSVPGRNVYAGCAGMAQVIAQTEKSGKNRPESLCIRCGNPVVLCGSLNTAAKAQLAYAEQAGIRRLTLSYDGLCSNMPVREILKYADNGPLLIDTDEHIDSSVPVVEAGRRMAEKLGCLCRQLAEARPDMVIFVIGGDTLAETLHALGDPVLFPLGEPRQGTVAFLVRLPQGDRIFISRSGGFGTPDCISSLIRDIQGGIRI